MDRNICKVKKTGKNPKRQRKQNQTWEIGRRKHTTSSVEEEGAASLPSWVVLLLILLRPLMLAQQQTLAQLLARFFSLSKIPNPGLAFWDCPGIMTMTSGSGMLKRWGAKTSLLFCCFTKFTVVVVVAAGGFPNCAITPKCLLNCTISEPVWAMARVIIMLGCILQAPNKLMWVPITNTRARTQRKCTKPPKKTTKTPPQKLPNLNNTTTTTYSIQHSPKTTTTRASTPEWSPTLNNMNSTATTKQHHHKTTQVAKQQQQQQSDGNLIQVSLKTWRVFFLFSKVRNLEKCVLFVAVNSTNFGKFRKIFDLIFLINFFRKKLVRHHLILFILLQPIFRVGI